jgi:hypothetical protein
MHPCAPTLLLSIALAVATLPAQAESDAADPPGLAPSALGGPILDGPILDGVPDAVGGLWARGHGYKIAFAAGAVRFYPRFRRADRHWPLALRLTGLRAGGQDIALAAQPAVATGARQVRWSHGPVIEVWDLHAEAAEQSFVVAARPGEGDLQVLIGIATELALAEATAQGLRWECPGHGAVTCTDAVVRDAAGRTQRLAFEWADGAMRLVVPDAFLDAAAWPVVVDPFVRAVLVDNTAEQLEAPRVAVDPLRGQWLVACLDSFNAADRDVRVLRFDRDGTLLERTFAETGTADVSTVDLANQAGLDLFLLAWVEVSPATIRRRTRQGGTTSYGAPIAHPFPAATAPRRVAVGGGTAGDAFLVAGGSSVGFDSTIDASVVDGAGAVRGTGTLAIAPGFTLGDLVASPLGGPDARWGVAYELFDTARGLGNLFFLTVEDQTLGSAIVTTAPLTLRSSSSTVQRISATTTGAAFVVGWQEGAPVHVHAGYIDALSPGFFALRGTIDLTNAERGAASAVSVDRPVLVGDGCRLAMVYREGTAVRASNFRLRLQVSVQATVDENQRSLAIGVPGLGDVAFAMVPVGRPDSGRCLAVWELEPTAGQLDLNGALYEARSSGAMFATVATACGTAGTTAIAATGTTSLGGRFAVQVTPAGVPIVIAGLPLATPVAACAVSACRRGVQLPALGTSIGNVMQVTVPCDGNLLGTTLAFQAIDLGPGDACPVATVGVPFRTSDTIHATVR